MELLFIAVAAVAAVAVLVAISYPINGHGGGYYPYFGPDGDRGARPGSRSDDLHADDRGLSRD